MIIGAIILLIVSIFTVKKEKEKIEQKKQLLTYEKNLTPEERKELKNGNYKDYNFEEEETEDDDFYNEDDIDEE